MSNESVELPGPFLFLDYLESVDAGELDDDTKALIVRTVERSEGHSERADHLSQRASPSFSK